MGTGMRSMFVFSILVMVCPHMAAMLKCWEGTYVHKFDDNRPDVCTECPDGTVMPHKKHQKTSCLPCEKVRDSKLEILVSPCNKTHQAVIHCVEGYYRDPDYHGAPECRPSPWFCRRGHYFNTDKWGCSPCPENTFMPLDYHVEPECWKCREYHKYDSYRPLHSVIIYPCNRTHAPAIRCEDGFFMDHKMSYRGDSTGCSPCTDCSTKTDVQYEGRKCDGMEDTVCCPDANMTVIDTSRGPLCCPEANVIVVESTKNPVCCPLPNMTVVDTPDGPVCKAPIANPVRCGVGLCPHQGRMKRSVDCAPCPLSPNADDSDDTGERLGNADLSTSNNLDAQKSFSNDDQRSSAGFSPIYIFVGIVIGVILSLVCYLIYTKFYRPRWQRQWVSRKRSRSEMNEQTEYEDYGESSLLDTTSNETRTSTTLRRRQIETSSGGTKQHRYRFIGSSRHLATIDDHCSEQCCGNESDLHLLRESCEFVKDHESFIPANSFAYEDLPEGLREDGKMAYIKAVRDLTVRLKVNHTSESRPKNYPCHEVRGHAGIKRFGTGLVFQVIKKFGKGNNSTCPCTACKVKKIEAKGKWAEFAVVTAAHVVYDSVECAQTSCRLWFDDDEDYIKARSINGRRVEKTNKKTPNVRIMHCTTHDEKVSQKLEEKIAHLNNLRGRYDRKSTTEVEEERLAVLISHQHALSKKISVGEAKMKMDGNIQKLSYNVANCPGSCGAPICILGKSQGSGIVTTIHSMGNESTGFYI